MLDFHLHKAHPPKVQAPPAPVFKIEKRKLEGVDTTTLTLMLNANTLLQHQEYQLALNLLRQACNANSKHPEILKSLAWTLEKLSRWSEAQVVYVELSKQFNNFQYSFKKAQMSYLLNDDQAGLAFYYEALSHLNEEDQDLFELYKNMGNIFVRNRDFEAAEESYNKAYTLNPNSDVLLINFGTLEVQREDFDKALFCFRKAVEVNPLNDKAWIGLALVHNQFGDLELAWGNLIKALDINPRNRTAILLIGHWGQSEDKIMTSMERHRAYLYENEFDEEITLQLIQIYTHLKRFDWAELEALKMRLWNPTNEKIFELHEQLKGQFETMALSSLYERATG